MILVCVRVSIFSYFTVQPVDYFHNTSYKLKTLKASPAPCVLITFSNGKLEGRTEWRIYTSECHLWVFKWCMVIQLKRTRKLEMQLYKGMLLVGPQTVRVNTAWKSTKFEEVATLANVIWVLKWWMAIQFGNIQNFRQGIACRVCQKTELWFYGPFV
jgi:hypothetical protein